MLDEGRLFILQYRYKEYYHILCFIIYEIYGGSEMNKYVLTKEKAKKLLCVLERSLVQDDDIDHDKKIELMDIQSQ